MSIYCSTVNTASLRILTITHDYAKGGFYALSKPDRLCTQRNHPASFPVPPPEVSSDAAALPSAFHSILKQLQKQGRISLQESSVVHLPETECADGMEAAFDVLLDFLPEVTYHAPGEFPVTLTFFAREECYEVIWLPEGKELLVSHALSLQLRPPDNYQRLIVLSSETQLELAGRLPDVTAYCLPRNGKIHYYKKGLTYGPNHPEYPA